MNTSNHGTLISWQNNDQNTEMQVEPDREEAKPASIGSNPVAAPNRDQLQEQILPQENQQQKQRSEQDHERQQQGAEQSVVHQQFNKQATCKMNSLNVAKTAPPISTTSPNSSGSSSMLCIDEQHYDDDASAPSANDPVVDDTADDDQNNKCDNNDSQPPLSGIQTTGGDSPTNSRVGTSNLDDQMELSSALLLNKSRIRAISPKQNADDHASNISAHPSRMAIDFTDRDHIRKSNSPTSSAPSPTTTGIATEVSTNNNRSRSVSITNSNLSKRDVNMTSVTNFTKSTASSNETNFESQIDSVANDDILFPSGAPTTSYSHDHDLEDKSNIFKGANVEGYNASSTNQSTKTHLHSNLSSSRRNIQDSSSVVSSALTNNSITSNINPTSTTMATTTTLNSNNDSQLVIDDRDAEISAELRWTPGVPDCDLMMYLRAARSMAAFASMTSNNNAHDDCNPATRDDTTINALELLHECNYDTGRALQVLVKNPIPRGVDKKWSDEEQKRFIRGIRKEGKDFFKIRNELLPHKEVSELVEFYYLFKKTSLFTGSKNNRRRRATPSKLKSSKNLINRENALELGDCASSDESGDGSNDNEDSKKLQCADAASLQDNASNSPVGDMPVDFQPTSADEDQIEAVKNVRSKDRPRSAPSINQMNDDSQHLDQSINENENTPFEIPLKQESDSSIKIEKVEIQPKDSCKDERYSPTAMTSTRTDEKISKSLIHFSRSSPKAATSPNNMKLSQEFSSQRPPSATNNYTSLEFQRNSPNKPPLSVAMPSGCSSLVQLTDSIGQPSPNQNKSRSSPTVKQERNLNQQPERLNQASPSSNPPFGSKLPPTGLPPGVPPFGPLTGLGALPPNMQFFPNYLYGHATRPGAPPLGFPPMFPGIPGLPGYPMSLIPPVNATPPKIPTSKSGSNQRTPVSASPVGGLSGPMSSSGGAPMTSPHGAANVVNTSSPNVQQAPSKHKSILTRVIQRPDQITCARTDFVFRQPPEHEMIKRYQERKRKLEQERELSESKKMTTSERDTNPLPPIAQHQNPLTLQQPNVHQQQPPPPQNVLPPHLQPPRERELHPPPSGPPGSVLSGQPDASHLLHPAPSFLGERPQPPRFMDVPTSAPFNFRHSPADLGRPHTAFSPAGFGPRATPTSIPTSLPGFPQGVAGFPNLAGLPPNALETFWMQYYLHNSNLREQEEREREIERERRDQEMQRLANAGPAGLDFELQRRIFASQHPNFPMTGAGAGHAANIPPQLLHNAGSPNHAAMASVMNFASGENQPEPPHMLHPLPGSMGERPQHHRFMDAQPTGPFNFRHSPADLTRPHAAFSPAGFPPRGTPTSLPSSLPGFPQGANCFPSIPGMPANALESFLMQYHLYN